MATKINGFREVFEGKHICFPKVTFKFLKSLEPLSPLSFLHNLYNNGFLKVARSQKYVQE